MDRLTVPPTGNSFGTFSLRQPPHPLDYNHWGRRGESPGLEVFASLCLPEAMGLGAPPYPNPRITAAVRSNRQEAGRWEGHLLAEVEEELLKDEDGSRAAEYDERLSREEAEQGASHGSAQETLHHSLGARGL